MFVVHITEWNVQIIRWDSSQRLGLESRPFTILELAISQWWSWWWWDSILVLSHHSQPCYHLDQCDLFSDIQPTFSVA